MKVTALLALLLIAASIHAQKSPTQPSSNPEGQALAEELRSQRPTEKTTAAGALKIRDAKGKRTEIPVSMQVLPGENDWQAIYATKDTNGATAVELIVAHHEKEPTQYTLIEHSPIADGSPSRKVLTGMNAMVPFAGTDFWLADLGLEFFHWPNQRLVKKEIKRGQACKVLESSIADTANPGAYVRVVSWIDSDSDGIVQAEAYDANSKLIKTFAPKSFQKVNGQYQLKEMEIRDEQKDSRTRLEFDLNPGKSNATH